MLARWTYLMNRLMNYRNSFAITLALAFLAAVSANAQTQDIGIVPDGLRLHPTPLVAGWETRIYVTVRNNTSEDTRGFVSFLDNGAELGVAPISLKGGGVEEEAWYAWRPTYGSHAISAIVHLESGTDAKTRDNRVDRDVLVDRDSDGDGILDGADADDDNDGIVDTVEVSNGLDPLNPNDASADADGDGITNRDEIARGLNPRSADTDGDGSPDGVDAFPLDAKRQRVVAPPPPPAPIPTPISSIRVNASPPVSTSPPPAPLPPAVEQETVVRSNPEQLAQSLAQESVQRTKMPPP